MTAPAVGVDVAEQAVADEAELPDHRAVRQDDGGQGSEDQGEDLK